MPEDDTPPPPPPPTEVGRSPGYIPRPPSRAEVERVSDQQGMITDEWAPSPTPPSPTPNEDKPGEKDTERQPG